MDFSSNVRAAFNRAAPLYDRFSDPQRISAELLLRHLPAGLEPRLICELGCGTGILTRPMLVRFPSVPYVGVDVSRAMIERVRPLSRSFPAAKFVEADARSFLPAGTDLVVSSSSVHWMEPLEALFRNIRERSASRVRLFFLAVLKDAYRELHALRRELFPEKIPAGRLRSAAEMSDLLEVSGFRVTRCIERRFLLEAPSARGLLESISASGVTCGAVSRGATRLRRSELRLLEEEYQKRFRAAGGGVSATYEVGIFDAEPLGASS